jgi:hypothetical protein
MATENKDSIIPSRVKYNKIYYVFYLICTHSVFSIIIILLIFLNTFILSFDRYPIDDSEFKTLGR